MAGGPDTKAAKAYQAAVKRDARRQADTPEAATARRAQRQARAETKAQEAARAWAADATDEGLRFLVNRGDQLSHGRNHLLEAAQAELDRRRPKA